MGTRFRGTADLPLHTGKAPPWLFSRMRELGGQIAELMVDELGTRETIGRMSDPFWFQALSCILGFDWHSSGTTTVTLAAMKEGMAARNLQLHIVGGKGKASTSISEQLSSINSAYIQNNIEGISRISRLSARVDNIAVQDGYDLYHHSVLLDEAGNWSVIQQGMNERNGYARRYHWQSERQGSMVIEPHQAILGEAEHSVTDFTARESEGVRRDMVEIGRERNAVWYNGILLGTDRHQTVLDDFSGGTAKRLRLDWSANWKLLKKNIETITSEQPRNFEELLQVKGVGKKTLMALAMACNLVYGDEPSWRDPVRYSFAVGGKDGIPYPVNTKRMEKTADIIRQAVEEARVGDAAKSRALRTLSGYFRHAQSKVFGDN